VLQRTTTGDGFEKVDDSAGRGAKPILRFRAHDNGGACWRTRRVLPVPVAKPGQEIKDGLQTIEGEADILTCIGEDGLNGKHHLLKVFVKKLTRFQAWKRMVDIQKQLCGVVPAIGDGFRLEEIGDDGTPIREAEGGSGLSVILNPLLLGCTATPELHFPANTKGHVTSLLAVRSGSRFTKPGLPIGVLTGHLLTWHASVSS
ncbi:hypothetical protein LINPERPRIM_LOCUS29416, partial [Linum perenne]